MTDIQDPVATPNHLPFGPFCRGLGRWWLYMHDEVSVYPMALRQREIRIISNVKAPLA